MRNIPTYNQWREVSPRRRRVETDKYVDVRPTENKIGICKYYKRGLCNNGEYCKYKHEDVMCWNYARGECKFGEHCYYSHNTRSKETSRNNGRQLMENHKYESSNYYTDPNIQKSRSKENECWNFREKGECKYGMNCKFDHIMQSQMGKIDKPTGN